MSGSGEFALIDAFVAAFQEEGGKTTSALVEVGPGDDAALLRSSRSLVVTTDALVEGVHFRRSWSSWRQLGRKALAVNLSDIAAMGAQPAAFTCALTVPGDVDEAGLLEIARGLAIEASPIGCVLAGGNFSRGRELSVTITALGIAGDRVLRRDKARAGDIVLLAGEVGVAAAELRWLERGQRLPNGRSALLEPKALVDAGLRAVRLATCGIDVSDGLVQDLGHVAQASRVAIRIDAASIPRSPRFSELTAGFSAEETARCLLAGGEDYALVITASPEAATELRRELDCHAIGFVEAGEGVSVDGAPPGVVLTGHDHFRTDLQE